MSALDDNVVEGAANEIVTKGADRSHWLCFCTGVDSSYATRDALKRRGVNAEAVLGETPSGERDRIFAAFRAGEVRALTGCMVFTTGFDIPQVDLIAMLRPTCSTGLYVQMVGRGTRKADGKLGCLVLDFSGNVKRHGPVDAVSVHVAKPGDAPTKVCPVCQEIVTLAAST